MTLSPELRAPVPTAGGIHQEMVIWGSPSQWIYTNPRSPALGGYLLQLALILSALVTGCDGEQLKLSDSDRGSNTEYTATSYYLWSAGSAEQLLFIFSTKVSLTIITLHYYSDSVRGLPRLRFYAVPDDFDVWNTPTTGTPHVNVASVPPGGEPVGRRSVSISVNFNTQKVLMYKYSNSFQLALSEVELFQLCDSTSKYLYADCCILSFLHVCYDLRLSNMYSGWDH